MVDLANEQPAAAHAEVSDAHDAIIDMGLRDSHGNRFVPEFFRFPHGASNCASAQIVRSYGYKIAGWTIDSADWCFNSSTGGVGICARSTFRDRALEGYREDMVAYIVHQAKVHNGGALLFHDIKPYTVKMLPKVLGALVANGFRFVRLDDPNTFPQLNGAPTGGGSHSSGLAAGTCLVTASGGARGWDTPSFSHSSVKYDYRDVLQLVDQDTTNGFFHVRLSGEAASWVWHQSLACNASGVSEPPPAPSGAGTCTITAHGGTRAFKSPSFSGGDWGVLPEGHTYKRLDSKLYAGAFYRIDPQISGVSDAYIWETKASCH
jgi:hypothetical protein